MRIVALSDTHGFHNKLTVPDGDIFICAGDFAMRARLKHVSEFAKWVNHLPHKHKIVVAGNHDCACEEQDFLVKDEFSPSVYLRHDFIHVDGVCFFGSPYTSAVHDPSQWNFDYPKYGERGKRLWLELLEAPKIDVLITHGPPYGIMDRVLDPHPGEDPHVGDETLLRVVKQIQPKVHIFGHIHEGYGKQITEGPTQFYNVSVCDVDYKPINPITVIDLT